MYWWYMAFSELNPFDKDQRKPGYGPFCNRYESA